MRESFRIVFLGLTITSSWGNGHATTYRALIKALRALGHEVTFLERDSTWYAEHRDLLQPAGCDLFLYDSVAELRTRFGRLVREADAVIVGSYVPEGAEVLSWVLDARRGLCLFYDIDTPVTLSKLLSGEDTYISRGSIPELDAYLSFSGGPALPLIVEQFGARLALPLYCSVDESLYRPGLEPPFRELGYLGTYSADRQPGLERALFEPARRMPEARFIVAGPCYPGELVFPVNVERAEHVSPPEHPSFYGSLRFALNVTRFDMIKLGFSPSVRLFEAAACATPVISDRWRGIERFFEPGREILLAEEPEQVLEILSSTSEEERLAIGRRARARVLAQHTARHRARELERYLCELYAGRSSLLRAISAHETRAPASSALPPQTMGAELLDS